MNAPWKPRRPGNRPARFVARRLAMSTFARSSLAPKSGLLARSAQWKPIAVTLHGSTFHTTLNLL